jgi:hypothetical protein
MSSAKIPQPQNFDPQGILPPAPRLSKPAPRPLRRRGNREQGRALEAIGHALEYLIDSRMFLNRPAPRAAEAEAIQILMRASRAVFAECAEVVPVTGRIRSWMEDHLFRAA